MSKSYFFVSILLLCAVGAQAQFQIGNTVNGTDMLAMSGHCTQISANGNFLVVGSPSYTNSTLNGSVQVYRYSEMSEEWVSYGQPLTGESAGDRFGEAVAITADGQRIAVSAMHNDGGQADPLDNRGSVSAYEYQNGTWSLIGQPIVGQNAQDWSGAAIAMTDDGNILAIGSPMNDDNGNNAGKVDVYSLRNGVWMTYGDPIHGANPMDQCGTSVAFSDFGEYMIVGYPGLDLMGTDNGGARVFKWNGTDWEAMGNGVSCELDQAFMGNSVDISGVGSIISVGASQWDEGTGLTRMYSYLDGGWIQIGQDIIGDAKPDNLGKCVSLSHNGNTVAIASPNASDMNDGGGKVSCYWFNESTEMWELKVQHINGFSENDEFGSWVDLTADGVWLAVGAPSSDIGTNDPMNTSGETRVFGWRDQLVNSLGDGNLEHFNIYPNPANDRIVVDFGNRTGLSVSIMDMNGKVWLDNIRTRVIDVSFLSNGSYVMTVMDETKETLTSAQFIIQR